MTGAGHIHSGQETKQINKYTLAVKLLASFWGYLMKFKVVTVDSFCHFNEEKASAIGEPSKNLKK